MLVQSGAKKFHFLGKIVGEPIDPIQGARMPKAGGDKKVKRTDIQILRAIAVIAVIVFHIDEAWLPSGFLGVDIFFVISGFLITGIITRDLNRGTFSLSDFYLRRIRRLFPALALILLVTTVLGIICLPPIPFRGLTEHLPWAALQVSNLSFMRGVDYFDPSNENNPVLHTWSLGVEEQYYLTWAPFLLLLFTVFKRLPKWSGEFRPKLTLVGLIVIGIALEILTQKFFSNQVSFFSPLSRSWELALGGLGATILSNPAFSPGRKTSTVLSAGGYVLIIASLLLLSPHSASNPYLRALPCLGALLILLFPFQPKFSREAPLKSLFVYIGDISYSLYLWHWPAICFSPYLLSTQNQDLIIPFSIGFFLLGSILSFHLCEKRFMHHPKWNRWVSLRTFNSITLLCVIAGGAFALQTEEDSSWRFDGGQRTAEEEAWQVPTQYRDYPSPEIDPYQLAQSAQVVLIGDSHARHFSPLASQWAAQRDKSFYTFWGTGTFCLGTHTARQRVSLEGAMMDRSDTCELSLRLLNSLKSNESLETVFIAQRTAAYTQPPLPSDNFRFAQCHFIDLQNPDLNIPPHEVYEAQVREFVESLRERGVKVILLGQVPPLVRAPKPGASILDQWLNREWQEDNIHLPEEFTERLDLEFLVYEGLSKIPGVYHLPSRSILTKVFSDDGFFLYDDVNHINYQGAIYFQKELERITENIDL